MASRHNPFPAKNPRGRPEYWTEERIDGLIVKLAEYVARDSVYDLAMYRVENDLTLDNVRHIGEKSPDFTRVYEMAKLQIGSKRQEQALKGDWHAGTIHRDDWKYCPEVLAYQREMKDKEAQSAIIPAQLAAQAKIDDQERMIKELQSKLEELSQ